MSLARRVALRDQGWPPRAAAKYVSHHDARDAAIRAEFARLEIELADLRLSRFAKATGGLPCRNYATVREVARTAGVSAETAGKVLSAVLRLEHSTFDFSPDSAPAARG